MIRTISGYSFGIISCKNPCVKCCCGTTIPNNSTDLSSTLLISDPKNAVYLKLFSVPPPKKEIILDMLKMEVFDLESIHSVSVVVIFSV